MKLYLDVDGVCLNWAKKAAEINQVDYESLLFDTWSLPWVDETVINNNSEYWHGLDHILPGTLLDELPIAGYLSSFPAKYYNLRADNLFKIGFPRAPIISCFDKVKWCQHHKVDILVDDKPSTIKGLLHTNTIPVQFYPSYANWEVVTEAHVVNNYTQLYALVQALK